MFTDFIIVPGNVRHNVNGNANYNQVLLKEIIILYTFFCITAMSWEIYYIPNRINVLALY